MTRSPAVPRQRYGGIAGGSMMGGGVASNAPSSWTRPTAIATESLEMDGKPIQVKGYPFIFVGLVGKIVGHW